MSIRELPPLAQLRAFAALAEAGSMSAAGALLNVSHAAISQQVRALERQLGLALVARDGRGLRLTGEGAQLAAALSEGFGTIGRELRALTEAQSDRPVQVTTTPMFAAAWLMPRLGAFHQRHPDIDLMLNPTPAQVALEPGGIDLAIRFGRGDWPGLECEPLVQTDFVIAAARSLVGDRPVRSPADLLDFPWLQEVGTTETNDWLRDRGISEARVRRMTHLPGNLLLDGLRSGQGIAATTRAFIEADMARGDVVVLFEGDDRGFGYFLLHRPGVLRPGARAFARWIRQAARTGDGGNGA